MMIEVAFTAFVSVVSIITFVFVSPAAGAIMTMIFWPIFFGFVRWELDLRVGHTIVMGNTAIFRVSLPVVE